MGGRGVNVLRVGRQMLGSREDKQQSPAIADKPRDAVKICSGHSRSSKVTPFNCLHMVSYYRPGPSCIVTLCLKCTVFEMATYWTKIT